MVVAGAVAVALAMVVGGLLGSATLRAVPASTGIPQRDASLRVDQTPPQLGPGTLTDPTPNSFDEFGSSVATNGPLVVVGTPYATTDGDPGVGIVYVYNTDNGSQLTLLSPNVQTDESFGTAVAISGATVVVGAPYVSSGDDSNIGEVFEFNATTGALLHSITSPNAYPGGLFGDSLATSGNLLAVGAPYEEVPADPASDNPSGQAYLISVSTGLVLHTLASPSPASYGGFGLSVAVSGSHVLIGAPDEYVNSAVAAGNAYLFSATTGDLIATLPSPDPQALGYFGGAVALSGTTAVVGAPDESFDGLYIPGRAYVYQTTGALVSTLTSPNDQDNGSFGGSVAVSGDLIVVGAGGETYDGQQAAGTAYTYRSDGGTYLFGSLASAEPQSGGGFGSAVAIGGSRVVVGAPGEDVELDPLVGHVYLFQAEPWTWTAADQAGLGVSLATSGSLLVTGSPYTNVGTASYAGSVLVVNLKTGASRELTSPNAAEYGLFGQSVAISGTTLVVGAPGENASGTVGEGNVYVFNASTGGLERTLAAPNPATDQEFGYSVALSGATAVVGAPGDPCPGGYAYIFDLQTGAVNRTIETSTSGPCTEFGEAVGISGELVVVGAPAANVADYTGAGLAYVYELNRAYVLITLASPNAQSYGEFGDSVAISGTTAVIGAPFERSALNYTDYTVVDAGNAYVFDAPTAAILANLSSPSPQADANFGTSVAISGGTALIGAPYETSPGGDPEGGVAYLFEAKTGTPTDRFASLFSELAGGFGTSVALAGATIAVGAPFEVSALGPDTNLDSFGNVYIF